MEDFHSFELSLWSMLSCQASAMADTMQASDPLCSWHLHQTIRGIHKLWLDSFLAGQVRLQEDTMVANDAGSEEVHSAEPTGLGYTDEDPFDVRNREGTVRGPDLVHCHCLHDAGLCLTAMNSPAHMKVCGHGLCVCGRVKAYHCRVALTSD